MNVWQPSPVRFLTPILCLWLAATPVAAAQDIHTVRLVDQRGVGLTLNQLEGRPVVVTFVATRCTDACPLITALFGKLRARLRHDRIPATLLEVTLDPKNDSPFVMADYARKFGAAKTSDWRLASGPRPSVEAWMKAFGVSTFAGKNGIPEEHTTFAYVLDKNGAVASTMLFSENFVDQAEQQIRQLPT